MKTFFTLFLIFNFYHTYSQISGEPAWIKKLKTDFADTTIPEHSGGYYYQLIDVQDHLEKQTRFIHYAIQVINNEGIQSISDISVSHDPSYQKLFFHKVLVHRNGKIFDKLSDHTIHTFQRETNMERHLYDGSVTSVINLTDIREGDIIEYSYSRIGYNPLYDGKYFERFYLEYNLPINIIYNSVTTSKSRNLFFKYFNGATEAKITETGNEVTYFWNETNIDPLLYDNNVPAWYDQQKSVAISDYSSWKDVVDWGLPLYQLSQAEINSIKKNTEDIQNTKDRNLQITKAIRFVQDEVRYLGFESGLSAYQPNPPKIVLSRRFGDCKDKSLLLVGILRSVGLDANPVLVNTSRTLALHSDLPAPTAFNHCVVQFHYQGKDIFIDPTINNQGGSWDAHYFPPYKKGLIIKSGNDELTDFPVSDNSKTVIKELISAEDFESPAKFIVRTEYFGDKADFQRSYFKNNTRASIRKDYLNYYSSIYPEITSAKELNFLDYDRNSINKVIVEEEYLINNFWQTSVDNQEIIYSEVYPLVLENLINVSKSSERKMPYYLGSPASFKQETIVELPEDWVVNSTDLNFETDAFKYRSTTRKGPKTIIVSYEYETLKDFIDANEVKDFIVTHEKIRNDLALVLSRDRGAETFKLSWLTIILMLTASGIGIFYAKKLYNEYNPVPQSTIAEHDQIGGWLILVAIGLVLSPILILKDIITTEYYNHNLWKMLLGSDLDNSIDIALLVLFELIYNCLFLIFSILILILFFKRRSSLPRLITIYYSVNLLVMIVDTSLALGLMPEQYTEPEKNEFYRTILRSTIAAFIWIPYFNKSERVKKTFTVMTGKPIKFQEPLISNESFQS